MTGHITMTDDWQAKARQAERGRRNSWTISIAAGFFAGLCWAIGLNTQGAVRAALLIAAVLLFAVTLAYGTAIYLRRIDEQERTANFQASYVALSLYILLFIAKTVLNDIGISIPHADAGIFALVLTTAIAVFAWLRFR